MSPGVPTSPRRRYLISYLRMSPLGSGGSSQRRRTLLLLAASQATFPGIPSASPAGEAIRQPDYNYVFSPSCSNARGLNWEVPGNSGVMGTGRSERGDALRLEGAGRWEAGKLAS